MLQDLGKRVRMLREQKGIGLNAYAKILGVSSGYLSNLETGKTDSVHLSVLTKLQEELSLLPLQHSEDDNEVTYRLTRIHSQLTELHQQNPEGVEYLLQTLEKGIEVLTNKN
jgi:transcriptional regulator with XRE-family HTH domain